MWKAAVQLGGCPPPRLYANAPKEGGPNTGLITPETYLEEGSDFQKKKGGSAC
jgi:hypothetical protein